MAAALEPRPFYIPPLQEYRFELERFEAISIRLESGTAEIFGFELAEGREYGFSDECRGAVFTWKGAQIQILGRPTTEYVAEETPLPPWINVHLALERLRILARSPASSSASSNTRRRQKSTRINGRSTPINGDVDDTTEIPGPRVMIVGPTGSGKTSLAKTLINWAVKAGREGLVYVNLDPSEGNLGIPGTLSLASVSSFLPTTTPAVPFGTTPTSGAPVPGPPLEPNGSVPSDAFYSPPIRPDSYAPTLSTLVFFYGHTSFSKNEGLSDLLLERVSGAMRKRVEESGDEKVWKAGAIIDTPGEWAEKKGWQRLGKVARDMEINTLLVVGNEKLNLEMSRLFSTNKAVKVVRVPKASGATEWDSAYRRRIQSQQIRHYFYGGPSLTQGVLSPFQIVVRFDDIKIYRVGQEALAPSSALPIGAKRQISATQLDELDLTVPRSVSELKNSVLAIPQALNDASEMRIIQSPVMGFIYVSEVDVPRKKMTILSPLPGRLPRKMALLGTVDWQDA